MDATRSMTRTRLQRAIAVTLCGLLVAACSTAEETGGGEATTTQPSSGLSPSAADVDLATFCDAAIEGEQIFTAGPELDDEGNPTPEGLETFAQDITPLLDDMGSNAPAEVTNEVSLVVEAARQAVEQGDPSSTETLEFFQADDAVDDFVYENCELETTQEIVAVDYAYEGVPASLPAGEVGLRLDNQGDEVHEAVIFRINDDVDMDIEELLQLPEEEAESQVEFTGVAFAGPGENGSAVVDLAPGRYALVCFIPLETTSLEALFEQPAASEGSSDGSAAATEAGSEGSAEGPPHFTQGMVAELEVE